MTLIIFTKIFIAARASVEIDPQAKITADPANLSIIIIKVAGIPNFKYSPRP